jgi:hypothetical protein
MATKVFNEGKERVLALALAGATSLRIALLSTNTTADTENDGIEFISNLATLDEFDGANYVRKTLASGAVAKDDANDRAGLDFADVTWTALGAGTRSVQGVLLYDHVGADSANPVWAWLEFASSKTPDGSDFTLNIADLLRQT